MKVLVTGGAGLIGSRVTRDLLARGDEVAVVDNFLTGRLDNLPPHSRLTLVEDTITDPRALSAAFESFAPDTVLHCAASYKDGDAWETDIATNIGGTVNVVRAARRSGVRRLVYLQTALCYGLSPRQPVTEEHPLSPGGSSYAFSKTGGELYLQLSGIDYIAFRLANVYGPGSLTGPMPIFYDRLMQGKPCFVVDSRRDFVFVGDLSELILMALDGRGSPGAYNASSGSDYAIKDLYDEMRRAMDLPPDPAVDVRPRGDTDAFRLLLEPAKVRRDFDWQPTTPLADGMQRLVEWYRRNPPQQFYTHLKLEAVEDVTRER